MVVRLRFLLVPGWIAAACLAATLLPGLGQEASLASLEPSDSAAARTELRSAQLFGVPLVTRAAVVQRAPGGLSAAAQARVLARADALRRHPDPELEGLRGVLPLIDVDGLVPGSRERSTTAISYLLFSPDASLATQSATAHRFAQRYVAAPDDALVGVTGASPARVRQWDEISAALPWVTIATVALIALVVGLHFQAVGAPLVTLAAAGIAYVVTIHLVGWLGRRAGLAVPREVEPVMVVLLLGVVTDYAIFFLSGTRRRLAEGRGRLEAAQASATVNIPIVFTAGLIVALGTTALVVGRTKFFQAFGPGLALTALVAMVVAITFVPAALALLGRAAFWPADPELAGAPPPADRGWRFRVAHLATARPVAVVVALLCVAVLGYAASGVAGLRLGFPIARDLSSSTEPVRAEAAATRGFARGILSPTEVVVEGRGVGAQTAALARLQALLAHRDRVAAVIGPAQRPARAVPGAVIARNGDAARFAVVLGVDPLGSRAIDAVGDLRHDLPGLLRQAGLRGARADLAGDTALARETISMMLGDLARIAIAALVVNLLVLGIFLRSLLAPLYLVAASVLALGASLGLTTVVFQEVFGFGELAYFVPFACAVLLAALGSDYNVFVVGRVWQEARTRTMREAVAVAAPRAARAITVAGLTLAASFAMLAIVPLRSFREFAFAMSVGVLLETFLVRSLLVPALISLFRPAGDRRRRVASVADSRV
jgi:RND superfamily putative drug exporter